MFWDPAGIDLMPKGFSEKSRIPIQKMLRKFLMRKRLPKSAIAKGKRLNFLLAAYQEP